jgi:hypothetical protein
LRITGLRRVIQKALPEQAIGKKGLRLLPTTMTVNPDLVFGSTLAVADVKYKIATDVWKRADLYQVVAFGTAYRVVDTAVIDFELPDAPKLPTVIVGDVNVRHIAWPADDQISPTNAAEALCAEVQEWLDTAATRT